MGWCRAVPVAGHSRAQGLYYLGMDKHTLNRQAPLFHSKNGLGPDSVVVEIRAAVAAGSGPFFLSRDSSTFLCVRVRRSNSNVMLVSPFRYARSRRLPLDRRDSPSGCGKAR
jgi:hypothetical protein